MDKYEKMMIEATNHYNYSTLEKETILRMLDAVHAENVKRTDDCMFEVHYKCDAMPDIQLNTEYCEAKCKRYYGCSNCATIDDLECLINQEKAVSDIG